MPTRLILAHSPFLGPSSWSAVARDLQRRGRTAEAPAWPSLSTIDGGFYRALAGGLAGAIDAGEGPAVLVAHSGAGALVPAVAAAMETPIRGVIFADAILPHPGRSWMAAAPPQLALQLRNGADFGLLPSWDQWWPPGALERLVPDAAVRGAMLAELEQLPLDYLEEPAPATPLVAPAGYLQLSGAYDDEARIAARQGWPLVRLPLHHLAMLTHAEAVAGALMSLAERLEAAHG
jgi:hypothetical protein